MGVQGARLFFGVMMKYFLIALLLTGCGGPGPAPSPADRTGTEIEQVCKRLRQLGCDAGKDTPAGATCEEYVSNAARNGIDLVGGVECTTAAQTCEQAEACK